nr:hypothetical protein [Mycobacterium sp. E2238]
MQLRYISIAALIAEAGGDPWAINKSLQSGSPGQISSLAEVFHRAGRCTSEAQHAFEQARKRFSAAWDRRDGGHPINDSAEVQRVTQSLGTQSLQLPKIGVDLENIAASLAEAQKSAAAEVATLEAQLQTLDGLIGQAVEMEQSGHLSTEDKHTLDALIRNCERDAIDDTKAALAQLHSIRNGYSDGLRNALGNLRTDGYDPAPLRDVDADGSPKPTELQLQALADLRRITDQAVVDQIGKVRAAQEALNKAMADLYTHGPGSPEGEAASGRLPKLKADLAHALDDLGKIPDYKDVDPASITITPDGRFMFTHTVDGQPVQVYGQLKNGAGEFFDQAMSTSYTFSGGGGSSGAVGVGALSGATGTCGPAGACSGGMSPPAGCGACSTTGGGPGWATPGTGCPLTSGSGEPCGGRSASAIAARISAALSARGRTLSAERPCSASRLKSVFRPCQATSPPALSSGPPTAKVMALHSGSGVASTFPGSSVRMPVNLPPLKV